MKKFLIFALGALMLAVLAIPLTAQDGPVGGIIIRGNAGGDPTALDPLLSSDTTASDIQGVIFPSTIGVDPSTAQFAPDLPDSLVTSWDVSEDGLTYTFKMRDDMYWNDGMQITADDVVFNYTALSSGKIDSPLTFALDAVASVDKIDDFTFSVTLKEASCDAIHDAAVIVGKPYPAQIAPEDLSTLPDQPFNLNPSVSAGVYNFGEMRPAEAITLVPNNDYVDLPLGYVNNDGFVLLSVPDLTVMVERFLAGELNYIDGPQESRRADIYAARDAGEANVYTYPGDAWDYLGFNLADPTNPQAAVDENGETLNVDQGMHPIFGNNEVGKDVRRALNLALNVDDIIDRATFGEGTRMSAHLIPSSWAVDPNLAPVPYDPAKAAQMLDDAGWVNSDPNDPTSVRVCKGCGTTTDGTEMRFKIITNVENARRTAIITIAQENWDKIGVKAEIQTIEFFTMLDILDAQTFDAYVLGWVNSYPDRPDATQILTPAGDTIGGSNAGSYNDPEFNRVNEEARTLPGCDVEKRKELYAQAQRIVQEDTPYIFLFVRNGFYATRSNVDGFDPYPSQPFWNVSTWAVRAP